LTTSSFVFFWNIAEAYKFTQEFSIGSAPLPTAVEEPNITMVQEEASSEISKVASLIPTFVLLLALTRHWVETVLGMVHLYLFVVFGTVVMLVHELPLFVEYSKTTLAVKPLLSQVMEGVFPTCQNSFPLGDVIVKFWANNGK